MTGPAAKPDPSRLPALAAALLSLQAGIAMARALDGGEAAQAPARWSVAVAPAALGGLGDALDLARAVHEAGPEPLVEYGDFDWLAFEDEPPLPDL